MRTRICAVAVAALLLSSAPLAALKSPHRRIGQLPRSDGVYTYVRPSAQTFVVAGKFRLANVRWIYSRSLEMYKAAGQVANLAQPDALFVELRVDFFSQMHELVFSDTVYVGNLRAGYTRTYSDWLPGLSLVNVSYLRVSARYEPDD